jgi:hypothetical protein
MSHPPSKSLSNHDTVLLAVYLLGGESGPIDTEDIAVKVNMLAPGAFTWRKYPDQINLEIVRVVLSNLKRSQGGKLLVGAGKDGWMLTERGLKSAKEFSGKSKRASGSKNPLSQKEKNWMRSERERMLGSPAFAKFRAGELDRVSEQEAEAFFRLDSYVTGRAREQKLLRLINVFGQDAELGDAVKSLEMKVRRN